MYLQKELTPEDVLNIVIRYVHKLLPEELKEMDITAAFKGKKGSIEIFLTDSKNAN